MAKIYLAPDDEITSVIEKLKNAEGASAVLVVPKNATLMQSVINVRLIKKKAIELGKTLGVVTSDPVSRHLASQVGLAVYATVEDVPNRDNVPAHKPPQISPPHDDKPIVESTSNIIEGVAVHSYERKTHIDSGENTSEALHQDVEINEPEEEDNQIEKIAPEIEPNLPIAKAILDHSPLPSDEDDSVVVGQKFDYQEESEHHHSHTLRAPRRPLNMPNWVSKAIFVLIALALIGAVALAVYFPTAEVILHVPTESTKKSITLLIDASATASESTVLVGIKHQAEAEGTGEAKASGKKAVGDKAKGTVTVSNSWGTDTEKLPKNTELISADKSLTFRTVSDVVILGASVALVGGVATISAGKTDVAVVADQPGDQYNIGPSKFTIQGLSGGKSSKITGASSANMSGGTTKELVVVAEQDVNQAQDAAKKAAEETAKTNLKNALPEGEMLLDKTISSATEANDSSHAVGDEVETVSVVAKASTVGYGVRNSDIENALKSIFQDGLADSKAVILPDISTIEWLVTAKNEGKYELAKEIEGQIIAVIDVDLVRKQTSRKLESTVSTNLQDKFSAASVEVDVSPNWWPLTPMLQSRISVKIEE